jgi:hypothetical protein
MNPVSIISLCVSGVMMIIGIFTFIFTIMSRSKADGAVLASIQTTLGDLVETVKEIKTDLKLMISDMSELDKRVSLLETGLNDLKREVEYLKSLTGD